MGAEPVGAPIRTKAPLWVDRWLGGSRETFTQNSTRENVKTSVRGNKEKEEVFITSGNWRGKHNSLEEEEEEVFITSGNWRGGHPNSRCDNVKTSRL